RTLGSASRSTTTPTSTPRACRTSDRTRRCATSARRGDRCRTRCESRAGRRGLLAPAGAAARELVVADRPVLVVEAQVDVLDDALAALVVDHPQVVLRALEHRHATAFARQQRIAGEQVGAPGLVVVGRQVELVDAVARRVADRQ